MAGVVLLSLIILFFLMIIIYSQGKKIEKLNSYVDKVNESSRAVDLNLYEFKLSQGKELKAIKKKVDIK